MSMLIVSVQILNPCTCTRFLSYITRSIYPIVYEVLSFRCLVQYLFHLYRRYYISTSMYSVINPRVLLKWILRGENNVTILTMQHCDTKGLVTNYGEGGGYKTGGGAREV